MSAMPLYHLWVKQNDYGCDYTIGCGERLIPLPISTLDQMAPAVIEALEHRGIHPDGERSADKMMIVQTIMELDPDEWDYREQEDEGDDEETTERRLYEKLKREFG